MNGAPDDYNSEVPPISHEESVSVSTDSLSPAKEERTYAMWMHFSLLATMFIPLIGMITPFILWIIKRDESSYINTHGKEIANWVITLLICCVIFGVISFFVLPVIFFSGLSYFHLLIVGWFLLFNLVFIATLITSIIGGVKAQSGQFYRYPCLFRFLK